MSNSFLFILITIYFFQIVSLKDINEMPFYLKKQRDILEKECVKRQAFCAMIPTIADIFQQIQKEEIEANCKNICNYLCLTYNNIHARDMICESLNTSYNEPLAEITFGNCSVLISGEIGYENRDYKNINFGTFLSELYIPSMTFSHSDKFDRISFQYENATVKFNYDNTRAVFKSISEDLNEHMEYILNMVYDEFISKIEDKIIAGISKSDIYSQTIKKIFNSFTFFDNGPRLFDEKKNVTYLLFSKIDHSDKILLKDKIVFFNLQVDFQFALNYNVTYNDGFFILRNVVFEVNEGTNNIYYKENITDMYKQSDIDLLNIDNKNELWELIINEFKHKFNEYKYKENMNPKKSKLF